jgi:Carboxypeptidase regulatory-like domain/Gram-negative bacterial TonB protein C-terminal
MVNFVPALLLTLTAIVAGQPFGSLTGTVVDPLGAVLPNARVALVQPTRQARYEISTDRNGQFEFQGLPSGDYQLEASTPGFQTYRDSLSIAGLAMQRQITLKIGLLHETIQIDESDAPPAPLKPALAYTEPACPAAQPGGPSVGGNLRAPRKLRDAKPDYPSMLRGTGRDATVIVNARIGIDGVLKDLEPREPVDGPFYDALVLALREWRFSATLLNCVPQEVEVNITANFQHR